MIFLRAVPPEVVDGVASGVYKVTGSVVRDVASGRGVAFLQETRVLDQVLGSAVQGAGAMLQSGFNPLGVLTAIQNQQIKSRLTDVQSSLAILQNLQVGTLAVAGLGIGVSIAGFALMLKKLNAIGAHLKTLERKIDQVTADRRSDDLRLTLADVGTQLEVVDTLAARVNRVASAEAAERTLATLAGRLEAHFQQRSEATQTGQISLEDMDMLWSLAAAIRLCHEAGLCALMSIDEVQAAGELASRRSSRFLNLSQGLSPDALSRLFAQREESLEAFANARLVALPHAEILVGGLRETVASIGSQAELSSVLLEQQISGADYLRELEEEKDACLLALPS
jgi:hypothetical protein